MLSLRCLLHVVGVCAAVSVTLAAPAQQVQPRLEKSLSESSRVVLPNSRTPRVRDAQDLGPVPPDMQVTGVTLVFQRSAGQQAELDKLLADLQTPGAPAYHQWLTPESFAGRFGVAEKDIATAVRWLNDFGLHVNGVARGRDRITFSGTAAQLQSAFGMELHHYRVNGVLHFAPAADLTLPAQLRAITAAVLHLSDFRPKPAWSHAAGALPLYTERASGAHALLPTDLAAMYDFTPANIGPNSKSISGFTQVAVVGQTYIGDSDTALQDFSAWSGGVSTRIISLLVPGSGVAAVSNGDLGESEIDLEYINTSGAAEGPYFVFVGDNPAYSVFDALGYAITENVAPVVSISYGICEPLLSTTELDQWNALFQQAAAQGQTLVAASGDSGSTACSDENTAPGITAAEQQSLAVAFPASSPYVTAVGGTQMAAGTFASTNTQYWNPFSTDPTRPGTLLSYVPEVAWNEGSANGILAGGGGSSSHFPRPAWQSAVAGIPAGSYRLVPDLALQASVASPGFVICTSDPSLIAGSGETSSCGNGLENEIGGGKITTAGGTSFAAPVFAGMVALINLTKNSNGLGNINPQLYALAANAGTYASAFHDTVAGTNSCVTGAALCTAASSGNYPAQAGYDEATGLGSLDVNALLAAWPAHGDTGRTRTYIGAEAGATYIPGESVMLGIDVGPLSFSASGPAPTGTVSLALDGVILNPAFPLPPQPMEPVNEVYYNLTAPSDAGYHLLVITYPGDTTHSAASTTAPFLVGSVEATGGFSLAAANLTIPKNSSGTTEVTATPSGGYNGKIVWSLNVTGGSTVPLTGCYAIKPLVVNNISMATLKIGVGTACSGAAPQSRLQSGVAPQAQQRSSTRQGAFMGLLLCAGLLCSRRRWRLLLPALLLMVTVVPGLSDNASRPY